MIPIDKIKKIAIFKLGHIGDVILFTPALHEIRKRFPKAEITMIIGRCSKEIIEENPDVDNIVFFDAPWLDYNKSAGFLTRETIKTIFNLRKKKFDLGIEVRGIFKNVLFMYLCNIKYRLSYNTNLSSILITEKAPYSGLKHEIDRYFDIIKKLGIKPPKNKRMIIPVSREDTKFIKKFLKKNKIRKQIIISPVTPWHPRAWPKKRFAKLADVLAKKYKTKIILAGSKKEFKILRSVADLMTEKTVIISDFTLKQFAALLKKSKLFIGNDCGGIHIASAMQTPTVAIFGPEEPKKFAPINNNSIVLRKKVNCAPCSQYKNKYVCENGLKTCKALKLLEVDEVREACEKCLNM